MQNEDAKHSWKSLISGLFIFSILVIMLLILFKNHSIDEIRTLFLSLNIKWLLAAIACVLLSYLAEMMCYYEITKKIYGRASLRTAFRVTMAGVYFNSVTPFACGGEPFQIGYMMKDGIPMGSCANVVMVKSTIFQSAVFISSILSFALNAKSLYRMVGNFNLFFAIGVSINLAVVLFFLLFLINKNIARKAVNCVFKLLGKCHIIKNPEKFAQKKEEGIECFINASKLIFSDPVVIIKSFFYQMLNLLLGYIIPFFLLLSLEGKYGSVVDIITSQAILLQITAYIPLPGAAGGAEGIGYFFFKNLFTNVPVVSVILIWRIITYYFNVAFSGLYLLLIKDKEMVENTKQIRRKAA